MSAGAADLIVATTMLLILLVVLADAFFPRNPR